MLQTPSRKRGGEWHDLETLAFDLTLWEDYADNVVRSFDVGTQVIARGRVTGVDTYESKGKQQVVILVDCDGIGPSLKHQTAVVAKRARTDGGSYVAATPATDRGFDVAGEEATGWGAAAPGSGWGQ